MAVVLEEVLARTVVGALFLERAVTKVEDMKSERKNAVNFWEKR